MHGDLKGVSRCLMRLVSANTIAPTAKYLHKSARACMSSRLRTLHSRRCGYTHRSPRSQPLGCEPRDNGHFRERMCLVGEPRAPGLELPADKGVGCLCPGDGHLRGSYIGIHTNVTMDSRSGTEQVLCKALPFHSLNPARVALEVMNGKRPAKPEDAASLGFTPELWEMIERCWLADMNARPTLGAVLSCLKEAAPSWDNRRKVA